MNLLTSSWDDYTKLNIFEEYMPELDLEDG
jgi:hypothetical protein